MKNEAIKFKVLEGSFVCEAPFTDEESKEEIIKALKSRSMPIFNETITSDPYAIKENETGDTIQFIVDIIFDNEDVKVLILVNDFLEKETKE